MAKGAYIGVGGVARKIKKGYLGVDGVARKIKKAYIGVGGVARLCWSSGELAYHGTATPLLVGRMQLAATSVGDFTLFAGGKTGSRDFASTVDIYNASLTKSAVKALSAARYNLAATSTGSYALFAGGNPTASTYSNVVDAYNTSLTKTTATTLSIGRSQHTSAPLGGATSVGSYALFAGGFISSTAKTDVVDAYDASLTQTSAMVLSSKTSFTAATTVGDYALFVCGTNGAYTDAYDSSLTKTTVSPLSASRNFSVGGTIGDYALFAGGLYSTTYHTTVDAYTAA